MSLIIMLSLFNRWTSIEWLCPSWLTTGAFIEMIIIELVIIRIMKTEEKWQLLLKWAVFTEMYLTEIKIHKTHLNLPKIPPHWELIHSSSTREMNGCSIRVAQIHLWMVSSLGLFILSTFDDLLIFHPKYHLHQRTRGTLLRPGWTDTESARWEDEDDSRGSPMLIGSSCRVRRVFQVVQMWSFAVELNREIGQDAKKNADFYRFRVTDWLVVWEAWIDLR